MLLLEVISQSNGDPELFVQTLHKVRQNYVGASGVITFDEFGDVQKEFELKTVRNGKFVTLE